MKEIKAIILWLTVERLARSRDHPSQLLNKHTDKEVVYPHTTPGSLSPARRVHVGGGAGAADTDVAGPERVKDMEQRFALLICPDNKMEIKQGSDFVAKI